MTSAEIFDSGADMTGRRIGPYLLKQQLGHGGMGTVYLGERRDDELSLKVAIKLLRREWQTPRVQERFRRERQTLADLRHPNIAQLMDAGTTEDGRPWLMMEWVKGRHIDVWCAENKPTTERILLLIRKIAGALGYAHRTGIIHCDIKPQNLMINHEGEPKLLDFGIAQMAVDEGETPIGRARESLMTPAYAAPEQKEKGTISAAADVYALGLVTLQLLIGRPPSRLGCAPLEAVTRLTTHGRQPIQLQDFSDDDATVTGSLPVLDPSTDRLGNTAPLTTGEAVPESLGYVLRRALAPTLEDRFQSMDSFINSLDHVIAEMRGKEAPQGRSDAAYDAVFWCHPAVGDQVGDLVAMLQREPGLKIGYHQNANPGSRELHYLLEQGKVCVTCLGNRFDANGQTPWQWAPAIRDKLAFHARRYHFLPLLLPDAAFPEKQSLLPAFLRGKTWLRLRDISPDGLRPLVAALRGVQQEQAPTNLPAGVCPFRGLEVFREQDAHLFFGREVPAQRIGEYMLRHPFGAVLGPSGSGKSSLVQAGVVPRLRELGYEICLSRPGHLPIEHLVDALGEVLPHFVGRGRKVLEHQLRSVPGRLGTLAAEFHRRHGKRLVVIIDQFEEIFTQCKNLAERNAFVEALCEAVERGDDHLHLLITMRSDFLGKCVVFHDLNDLITDHMLQLGSMTRDELARAVNAPAQLAGLQLEPGLLEEVLDEVVGAPGGLPLLEHALLELFAKRRGNLLTRQAYREIGGIEGALAKRAEYEYSNLSETQQLVLRKMFVLALIMPGDGTPDTRRQASGEELVAVGGQEVPAILRTWTGAHLLTASRDTARGVDVYEVAHEALIGSWARIEEWMAQGRETARMLNRLRQFARTWDEAGRDQDHLLRGGPLIQMHELVRDEADHLGVREKDYVAAGLAMAKQQDQRREETAAMLRKRKNQAVAASLIAGLLAAFAFAMLFQANLERDRAERERRRAEQARHLAEQQTLESNYSLAAMLTEEAGLALQNDQSSHAWMYIMTALSWDMPDDKSLPTAMGRFADPKMSGTDRLLWTSPVNPGAVRSLFTPDGSRIVIAGTDHRIRLLDLESGLPRGLLAGHDNFIRALAFQPESAQPLLASAGNDYQVRLWRLPEQPWQMQTAVAEWSLAAPVRDLAFSPDGRLLAALCDNGTRVLWRLNPTHPDQSQAETITAADDSAPWTTLRFAADGRLVGGDAYGRLHQTQPTLATGTLRQGVSDAEIIALERSDLGWITINADGNLYLWRDDTNDVVRPATLAPDNALALAVTADRTHVVTYQASGTLRLWDLKTGQHTWRHNIGSLKMVAENGELAKPDLPQLDIDRVGDRIALANGEWSMWHAGTEHSLLELSGFRSVVWSAAFSPDGTTIAAGSRDRRIVLWDVATGAQKRVLLHQSDDIFGVAWSPDGRFLAAASSDKTVAVYDTSRPEQPPRLFHGHTQGVRGIAFSPDGHTLASCSYDQSVRLWDLKTGATKVLERHASVVWSVAFAPDGRSLVSTSADHQVILWDTQTGRPLRTLQGHKADVWTAAFSPDGTMLATGSADHRVIVWDTETGRQIYEFQDHTASSLSVSFSPDGRLLASGSYDQTVAVWRLSDGELLYKLCDHNDGVWSINFSPHGQRLATASYDGTVKLWSIETPDRAENIPAHAAAALGVAFAPDGQTLASASMDQTVKLWDYPDGKPRQTLMAHSASVWAIAFSPNSRFIASASYDQTVSVWDYATRRLVHNFKGHQGEVRCVGFSPDSRTLASAAYDRLVNLWDLEKGSLKATLTGHTNEVWGLAYAPDGQTLATASLDQTVRFWDLKTMAVKQTLRAHSSEVWDVAYAPDGRLLAVASRDKTVSLWDPETLAPLGTLRGHEAPIWSCDFSPDGRYLATASADDTVRVWDVAAKRPLAGFRTRAGNANNVCFSPDGSGLVSAHDDGSLRFWRLDQLAPFAALSDDRATWRALCERSLFHFGYRFDGGKLVFEPRAALHAPSGPPLNGAHPYSRMVHPKPPHERLIKWLSATTEPSP